MGFAKSELLQERFIAPSSSGVRSLRPRGGPGGIASISWYQSKR